ncbi:choice-of-anchor J domain-containing protein [Marinicella sp. W31]|uniref:choice-of-anchor J domain-containing protein n=1 Tax=Marinicella sp. W31 TaxID=3023713 RepID=UPI00375687D2
MTTKILMFIFSYFLCTATDADAVSLPPSYELEIQKLIAQQNERVSKSNRGPLPDNVYLYETFESPDLPTGWVLFDLDGNTPNPTVGDFTAAWNVRPGLHDAFSNTLQSTSYYEPAGQADDWVITEQISIGEGARLRWFASSEMGIPDGYEVYISTTTQDIAGCKANPLLFSTDAEGNPLVQRTVDLGDLGYANQDIYICYRNNTDNGFALQIEDVQVYTPYDNDLGVVTANRPSEYTQATLLTGNPQLTLEVEVVNDGLLSQSNYTVFALVLKDNQLFEEVTIQVPAALAAEQTTLVTFPSFEITEPGNYAVIYDIAPATVEDENRDNNFLFLRDVLTVSKNVMARDDGFASNSLGFVSDNGGYLGNAFLIEKEVQLNQISFFFTNFCSGGCDLAGLALDTRVFSFDASTGLPDGILARSEPYTIPETDIISEEIVLDFSLPVLLEPGRYLLAVTQPAGPDQTIFVDTSENKYTAAAGWLSIPNDSGANWRNVEFYNRPEALMIRGVFSSPAQEDLIFQDGFDTQ